MWYWIGRYKKIISGITVTLTNKTPSSKGNVAVADCGNVCSAGYLGYYSFEKNQCSKGRSWHMATVHANFNLLSVPFYPTGFKCSFLVVSFCFVLTISLMHWRHSNKCFTHFRFIETAFFLNSTDYRFGGFIWLFVCLFHS